MTTKSKRILKPKPLKKGSQIALAAPSSHFRREHFDVALQYLSSRGYRVSYQEHVFSREEYLAGSDERRFAEMNGYLSDPDIDAIFLLRGGFGAARMFHLPIKSFKLSHPKHILGMSDHTFLLNHISRKHHLVTTHAPIITSEMFRTMPDEDKNNLMKALEKKSKQIIKTPEFEVIQKGTAKGQLWGGNLSIIQTTLGTPFENSWKGGILFLEDNNGMEYSIDRIFAHLYLTSHLQKISGFCNECVSIR